jgi:DNA-binding MarR family transcriptional regulator
LYLRGKYQTDIAEIIGVDQATISRDLKELRKQWLSSALVDLNEAKSKELAKIDQLELTYWTAWERSLGEFKSKTVKGKAGKEGMENAKPSLLEQILRTEEREGNPAFLSGIQWCINKRCALLGLDAPTNARSLNIDLSKLTDAQLQRIASGEDIVHVLATSGPG